MDLTVGDIELPSAATLGSGISVQYTVNNPSENGTTGNWYDAVYLATGNTWDVSDVLLGRVLHTGGVEAGGSYTETLTTSLPSLNVGAYHVIVRADVRNMARETDETNNTGVSSGTTTVGMPTLELGVPASGQLTSGQPLYYQFTVGAGETVRVSLQTSDPLRQNPLTHPSNDLYVSYGSVPKSWANSTRPRPFPLRRIRNPRSR